MFQSPLDAALRYAERGWPIFPCRPDKKPFTKNGFTDATTDESTIVGWWRKWPNAQVAVDCGRAKLVVVDLDLGKGKDGIAAFARLKDDHGSDMCGLIASTPRGGRHYVYRMPDEPITCSVDVIAGSGIDVRGQGGYIVIPSPASPGRDWSIGDPFDEDDIAPMPAWLDALVRGRKASNPSPGTDTGTTIPLLPDQEASIRAALAVVPADSRDVWIRVGMALKSTCAKEQAFAIWTDWSKTSSKFDARTQRKQWDSLREFRMSGTEVTIATLFHVAKEHGYEGEVVDPPPPSVPTDALVPQSTRKPFPVELLNVPGLVGDITEWIVNSSVRPQPALSLASALVTLGAVLGRRVASPTDVRTNVYCLGIGETGCGKDPSVRLPQALLARAGMLWAFGPGEWKSDSGLRAALAENPSHACYLDEFVKQLEGMCSKFAPPHLRGIKAQMLQAYSSANSVMPAAAYADRTVNKPTTIEQPCLSVYGVGVPGEMFKVLDGEAIKDGLLNRFLVFFSDDFLPRRKRVLRAMPPDVLVQRLQALERMTSLGDIANRAEGATDPRVIPFTDRAWELYEQIEDHAEAQIRKLHAAQNPLRDLWVRFGQNVQKVALIRSVADDPARPMDLPDLEWGAALVEWCTDRVIVEAEARVAESAHEVTVKKVLRLVADAGILGITKHQLTKRTQWLKGHERKDVMTTLLESGQIVQETRDSGGRPSTVYRTPTEFSTYRPTYGIGSESPQAE